MERQIDTSTAITRACVPAIDNILGHTFPVLDKGHVRVIDYMGDDAAIVQAARVSYGEGTKTPSDDRSLIRYMVRRWHTSPLEMCEFKVHMKLPLFVARQMIRHRTANVNEYSARYSIMKDEFYIPEPAQLARQSKINKQGRAVEPYDDDTASVIQGIIRSHGDLAYSDYLGLTDEEDGYGLTRELARMVLPVNIYTEWYFKLDLHNLFHLLRLRADPHAQYEIRVYADMLIDLMRLWVPMAAEAFDDYQLEATTLSRMELNVLRLMSDAHAIPDEALTRAGLGKREVEEFRAKFR